MFVFDSYWICISACMFVSVNGATPHGKTEAANHLTQPRSNKHRANLLTCWLLWPDWSAVFQPWLEDNLNN